MFTYISAQSASVHINKIRVNNSEFSSNGFNFNPINGNNNFFIDYTVKGDDKSYGYTILDVKLYVNNQFNQSIGSTFYISGTGEVKKAFSFSMNNVDIKNANSFKIEITYRSDVFPQTNAKTNSTTWIANTSPSNPGNPNDPPLSGGSGTCNSAPSQLYQTSDGNKYTFYWNPVEGTMPYSIAFRPESEPYWLYHTSNTNSFTINLTPNKNYTVAVSANCKLWSEKIKILTSNSCKEETTILTGYGITNQNLQANSLLKISSYADVREMKNVNARALKVIVSNIKILPKTRIYIQGCSAEKNENSIDDVIYSDIQSEITDSTTSRNSIIIPANIENNSIQQNLTISPNPTSNQVQINSTIGINEWYVYDINAKIVLTGNNKNANALKINLQNLNAGIYYFKFIDVSGTLHEKSIIKK